MVDFYVEYVKIQNAFSFLLIQVLCLPSTYLEVDRRERILRG